MEPAETIKLPKSKLRKLVLDPVKSAQAINLIHVSDSIPGIQRKGKDSYIFKGKKVTDTAILARIKSLVLPPAWTDVWICPCENGHLQATGYDVKHRKQYRYHPLWNALRSQTKYFHMLDFGKALPGMRKRIRKDLSQQELTQTKVLAAVVALMQTTCIRIGNHTYEKENGSFGLTTFKDKHVKIEGAQIQFSFKGKKGVYHDVSIRNKKLAKIVQACKDIPGKELFQYYDEAGHRHSIDSGMVNSYIREISGGNFTAKDFRTWAGTLHALDILKDFEEPEHETMAKKKIVEAIDQVAGHPGNTRAVCRKYYIHPTIIEHYTQRSLISFFKPVNKSEPREQELSDSEMILMKILAA